MIPQRRAISLLHLPQFKNYFFLSLQTGKGQKILKAAVGNAT